MQFNKNILRKSIVSAALIGTVFAGSSNIFAASLPADNTATGNFKTTVTNLPTEKVMVGSSLALPSLAVTSLEAAAAAAVASLFAGPTSGSI